MGDFETKLQSDIDTANVGLVSSAGIERRKEFVGRIEEKFSQKELEFQEAGKFLREKREFGQISTSEKLANIPVTLGFMGTVAGRTITSLVGRPIETGKEVVKFFTLPFRPKELLEEGIELGTSVKEQPLKTTTAFGTTIFAFDALGRPFKRGKTREFERKVSQELGSADDSFSSVTGRASQNFKQITQKTTVQPDNPPSYSEAV